MSLNNGDHEYCLVNKTVGSPIPEILNDTDCYKLSDNEVLTQEILTKTKKSPKNILNC